MKFVHACLVFLTAAVLVPVNRADAKPPNILFILIDDLGWMDLACQGNRLVETPHIDQLSRQGMRFTDAYAAAPVCSPTRAAIATGLAPARVRITNHMPDRPQFTPPNATLAPAATVERLSHDYVTIAERLRQAGYDTGFFGKWHLTSREEPDYYPDRHGFEVNVGGCSFGGPPTFFDPYRIPTITNRQPGDYLPDRLADEAIEFMRTRRDKPFLVCLWNYTVHWPMEAPQALLDKYATRTGPGLNDTRYGAMIEGMDRAIGRVLHSLDEFGLSDDTLVVFTSDNGGFGGVADNRPLRAAKGHLYEGGIRVPLIIRWPGRVKPATECSEPVISMDFYPTMLDAAGVLGKEETFDGVSLTPLFADHPTLGRDALYFHYPNYAWHRSNRLGGAIRQGRFKLIERFDDQSVELYDLTTDLGEQHNLAGQKRELARQLQQQLAAWREEVNAAMPTPR